MTGTVKTLAILGGVGGAGSLTIGGVYWGSKKTIGDIVKDQVLGTSFAFNNSWKDQHKKLMAYTGELSPELKKIKENHTDSEQEASREALKNWCKNTYGKTYKTALSKTNDSLIKEVKTYCIQSIREKLQATLTSGAESKVLSGDEDQEDFKSNYKKLATHNDSEDGVLDSELATWKKEASTKGDANWADLQKWCNKHYNSPFKGGTDLFKNLKKYCTKTAAA